MAINATDFLNALEEIEASKGISKESILQYLEESLIKAYRKQLGGDDANVRVNIDVEKGVIDMCQVKDVVDEVIRFIEYYNNKRPKEYLGGLSPVAFRQQNPKGVYLMIIQ